MVKSAFEFLLGVGQDARDFVRALHSSFGALLLDPLDGPLTRQWQERWPKATNILGAWAQEFCALRGRAAHGDQRGAASFVWTEKAHLAFASILFPLVTRKSLEDRQLLPMDAYHLARPYAGAGVPGCRSNWLEPRWIRS